MKQGHISINFVGADENNATSDDKSNSWLDENNVNVTD